MFHYAKTEEDQVLRQCINFLDLPLRYLDLTGFLQVTDDGAEYIAKMKHLQYLSLSGTKVTDVGVAKLAGKKKGCKVGVEKSPATGIFIVRLYRTRGSQKAIS